jgi:hypothetical protein
MVTETEFSNHGIRLSGKMKATMGEGIGPVEMKTDFRLRLFERLGLGGNGFGKARKCGLKRGGNGSNLLRLQSGSGSPGVEKSEIVFGNINWMKAHLILIVFRKNEMRWFGGKQTDVIKKWWGK